MRPKGPIAKALVQSAVRPVTVFSAVLIAAALVPALAAAEDRVDVDYINAEEFVEKGVIKIYIDILDADYNVVPDITGGNVTVFIDGNEVPGKLEVETFADAKEWVAVAILMAGHRGYAPLDAVEDADGNPIDTGPDVFKLQKQGFINFVEKLDGNDRVAVYLYNELGLKVVDNWSEEHATAASRIEKNAVLLTADERGKVSAPPLYKVLKEVVESKVGEAENLPRRRIVLVMSDGLDGLVFKQRKLEGRIDQIVEAARTLDVRVFALGFSTAMEDPLIYLQDLANKTRGIYRQLSGDRVEEIPQILENIAVQLKKQYVVTFVPSDDYSGSEESVKFRVKITTPGGRTLEDEYASPVKIGVKPTKIMPIIMWAGIGVGSLLLLFILFKVIGGIIRRRGERQPEMEYEEEEYVGPYKAKMTATSGPMAGSEFFLTEDVTTIGAIDGNSIVIHGTGISKRHAGVKIEDMRFELADFGSTNGTLVNGNKITKQFLRDGDEVTIGDCVLRFSLK